MTRAELFIRAEGKTRAEGKGQRAKVRGKV
jgi:hypothetical protein